MNTLQGSHTPTFNLLSITLERKSNLSKIIVSFFRHKKLLTRKTKKKKRPSYKIRTSPTRCSKTCNSEKYPKKSQTLFLSSFSFFLSFSLSVTFSLVLSPVSVTIQKQYYVSLILFYIISSKMVDGRKRSPGAC